MINTGINLWQIPHIAQSNFSPRAWFPPIVTGVTTVGETLTTTNGLWIALPPIIGYSYQWHSTDGMTINDIGADTNTFELTEAEIDLFVYCSVRATNTEGNLTQDSNHVGPIEELELHSFSSAYSSAYNI